MRPLSTITILFAFMILVSCNSKTTETTENIEAQSDLIEISKAQFKSELMNFGEPQLMPFSEAVHFTGTVSPSATGIAHISLPATGVIDKIFCNQGSLVKKGQVLFEVSGNEFIDMQRDLTESSAKLMQLKSNFEIVKELFDDNVGTQKELILAESTYKSENAKNTALKIKLEKIGLDISKIENGFFYSSYSLKTPINGYVTSINTTIGQYVEQQQIVVEIIDVQQFQLKLSIFEKEINKLQIGQEVEFYLAGNKNEVHKAKLKVVGKTLNNNSKAIDCFAEIEDLKNLKSVSNQFVEGKIIVSTDSVFALPETALLKSEGEMYVLSLENESDESYFFNQIEVKAGNKHKGFVELIDKPTLNKLLVKGAYNIQIE